MPDTTAIPPPKVEWTLWHCEGTRARWRPVMVGRSEREVIDSIAAQGRKGDWYWAPRGVDPNDRPAPRG
jgi:hypothetical protein